MASTLSLVPAHTVHLYVESDVAAMQQRALRDGDAYTAGCCAVERDLSGEGAGAWETLLASAIEDHGPAEPNAARWLLVLHNAWRRNPASAEARTLLAAATAALAQARGCRLVPDGVVVGIKNGSLSDLIALLDDIERGEVPLTDSMKAAGEFAKSISPCEGRRGIDPVKAVRLFVLLLEGLTPTWTELAASKAAPDTDAAKIAIQLETNLLTVVQIFHSLETEERRKIVGDLPPAFLDEAVRWIEARDAALAKLCREHLTSLLPACDDALRRRPLLWLFQPMLAQARAVANTALAATLLSLADWLARARRSGLDRMIVSLAAVLVARQGCLDWTRRPNIDTIATSHPDMARILALYYPVPIVAPTAQDLVAHRVLTVPERDLDRTTFRGVGRDTTSWLASVAEERRIVGIDAWSTAERAKSHGPARIFAARLSEGPITPMVQYYDESTAMTAAKLSADLTNVYRDAARQQCIQDEDAYGTLHAGLAAMTGRQYTQWLQSFPGPAPAMLQSLDDGSTEPSPAAGGAAGGAKKKARSGSATPSTKGDAKSGGGGAAKKSKKRKADDGVDGEGGKKKGGGGKKPTARMLAQVFGVDGTGAGAVAVPEYVAALIAGRRIRVTAAVILDDDDSDPAGVSLVVGGALPRSGGSKKRAAPADDEPVPAVRDAAVTEIVVASDDADEPSIPSSTATTGASSAAAAAAPNKKRKRPKSGAAAGGTPSVDGAELARAVGAVVMTTAESEQVRGAPLAQRPVGKFKKFVFVTPQFVYKGPFECGNARDISILQRVLLRLRRMKSMWGDSLLLEHTLVHDPAVRVLYLRMPNIGSGTDASKWTTTGCDLNTHKRSDGTPVHAQIVDRESTGVRQLSKIMHEAVAAAAFVPSMVDLAARYLVGSGDAHLGNVLCGGGGKFAAVDIEENRENVPLQAAGAAPPPLFDLLFVKGKQPKRRDDQGSGRSDLSRFMAALPDAAAALRGLCARVRVEDVETLKAYARTLGIQDIDAALEAVEVQRRLATLEACLGVVEKDSSKAAAPAPPSKKRSKAGDSGRDEDDEDDEDDDVGAVTIRKSPKKSKIAHEPPAPAKPKKGSTTKVTHRDQDDSSSGDDDDEDGAGSAAASPAATPPKRKHREEESAVRRVPAKKKHDGSPRKRAPDDDPPPPAPLHDDDKPFARTTFQDRRQEVLAAGF